MNKIKTMLVTVIAITSLTVSAYSFEGFSVGISGSQSSFDTEGRETKGQAGGTMEASAKVKKAQDVDVGSIFAEYSFAQGSTVGISYIPGEATLGSRARTMTQSDGQNVSGTITAKAEVSDHVSFYVEPTYMMSDVFGVYVKGAASRVSVNSLETQTSTSVTMGYGNQDVWGTSVGIGAKAYYGNLFLKVENMKTEYGTISLNGTNNKNITADIESDATTFSLGYNF
jgi:hypothetical protein|tara:strand:+ start:538 stop:1218 length:681 start_codon:yes stop_codon:yes gene_type:complete